MRFLRIRRAGNYVASIVIGLCLIAGCGQDTTPATLKVGLTLWPPNEMAYLARDLGLFSEPEIQLIEEVMPTEYVPTIANGTYDIIAVSIGSAAHVLSVNSDYRVVMLLSYSDGSDALVAQPEITTMADLNGKKVGYEPLALGTYLLNRFLATANMTAADIVPVPIDGLDQPAAFRNRQVDAIVAYDPTVARLAAEGAQILTDSRALPSEIMDVILVDKAVLASKHILIQKFVDAWFEALAYHRDNTASAAELAGARGHFSAAEYVQAFGGVVMLDRKDNIALFGQDNATMRSIVQLHTKFLADVGLTQGTFELAEVLDGSLVAESP